MAVCVCPDYLRVDENGHLCVVPGSLGWRQRLIFSTPGTATFQKATYPWLARVFVQVQGAGGGSAGANAASGQLVARPGGAGGGYSESLLDVASLPAAVTVTVGAGGLAGGSTTAGGKGGDSSFGTLVAATGGDGGTVFMASGTTPNSATGVAGPFAGTGDYRQGGGGGGGAIRLSATEGMAGEGGESRLGHGGFSRGSEGPGTASRGFGGGAGGALSTGTAQPGFEGGDGIVIVDLYA
ncbi:hypothetical protein JOL79_06985 [Microbispora sp. RL4-1S]|uniref:Glycine-rich domain-containing protein n=1 Tax=Microbispora oryzae TaxID=2806554 RepID=A0A941AIV7_9ACTN|nr:hypothetical protein [Microbispora oryzae]MBP2703543.1 hypothetical protein [Microbispora oryzae]